MTRRAVATVGAPMAWFVHLSVLYALVPTACSSPAGEVATWAATIVALGLAAASGMAARLLHRRARASVGGDDDREAQVDLLLGWTGQLLAVLFAVAIVAVATSAAVVGPCVS